MIANLWFFDASKNSDKTYDVCLDQVQGTYCVYALFGRRGARHQSLFQIYSGNDQVQAVRAYDKKLNEQLRQGYKVCTPVAA
jgi:predicted DNA-binding WGR domain protein